MTGVRTLVVWCPDWPVVAAGVPLDVPAAVLRANRVVACSPAARAEGVALHQRRREAQARCPALMIADHDPARDTRAFEPVVLALDVLTPRIEIGRPGTCAFPTRGPSRYHGGDEALAARAAALVSGSPERAADVARSEPDTPQVRRKPSDPPERAGNVRVGIADGPFAAALAARSASTADRPVVVPPDGTPAFLAPFPLEVLADGTNSDCDVPDLVDVLRRLGLRTLGDLAALPAADLVGRFGSVGRAAHRLASGLDERPPATAPPPPELTVVAELDPPAEQLHTAAFIARGMADDLQARLAARGGACTLLLIGAETEHGERLERLWRTEGAFTALAIADRMRWQLEGWIQHGARRPTGGLTRLWLMPDEVVAAGGRQLAFGTGTPGAIDAVEAGDRASRALARVQGLVGIESVQVPEWRGGRAPGERVALVPAAAIDLTESRPAARPGWVNEPWPGMIPEPSPATVHAEPSPAQVRDAEGRPVRVSGRGVASAAPATVAVAGGPPAPIAAWAGPWPCEERWWDPDGHRRRARLQVTTVDGLAHLLVLEGGRWAVEATYD